MNREDTAADNCLVFFWVIPAQSLARKLQEQDNKKL